VKAGVETRYAVHDLRHTAASVLLMRGPPLTEVAQPRGHAGPRVTAAIYAHLVRWAGRTALEEVEDFYGDLEKLPEGPIALPEMAVTDLAAGAERSWRTAGPPGVWPPGTGRRIGRGGSPGPARRPAGVPGRRRHRAVQLPGRSDVALRDAAGNRCCGDARRSRGRAGYPRVLALGARLRDAGHGLRTASCRCARPGAAGRAPIDPTDPRTRQTSRSAA
jgi:hypothetical protein